MGIKSRGAHWFLLGLTRFYPLDATEFVVWRQADRVPPARMAMRPDAGRMIDQVETPWRFHAFERIG